MNTVLIVVIAVTVTIGILIKSRKWWELIIGIVNIKITTKVVIITIVTNISCGIVLAAFQRIISNTSLLT